MIPYKYEDPAHYRGDERDQGSSVLAFQQGVERNNELYVCSVYTDDQLCKKSFEFYDLNDGQTYDFELTTEEYEQLFKFRADLLHPENRDAAYQTVIDRLVLEVSPETGLLSLVLAEAEDPLTMGRPSDTGPSPTGPRTLAGDALPPSVLNSLNRDIGMLDPIARKQQVLKTEAAQKAFLEELKRMMRSEQRRAAHRMQRLEGGQEQRILDLEYHQGRMEERTAESNVLQQLLQDNPVAALSRMAEPPAATVPPTPGSHTPLTPQTRPTSSERPPREKPMDNWRKRRDGLRKFLSEEKERRKKLDAAREANLLTKQQRRHRRDLEYSQAREKEMQKVKSLALEKSERKAEWLLQKELKRRQRLEELQEEKERQEELEERRTYRAFVRERNRNMKALELAKRLKEEESTRMADRKARIDSRREQMIQDHAIRAKKNFDAKKLQAALDAKREENVRIRQGERKVAEAACDYPPSGPVGLRQHDAAHRRETPVHLRSTDQIPVPPPRIPKADMGTELQKLIAVEDRRRRMEERKIATRSSVTLESSAVPGAVARLFCPPLA